MRRWLLVALLAAAAADIVGVEPESFDRRAQLRGDDGELERDKVQTYEDEQVFQQGSRTSKASEKDDDVGDNSQLKNLKELALCSAGLAARQATYQDANTHSLALANSIVHRR